MTGRFRHVHHESLMQVSFSYRGISSVGVRTTMRLCLQRNTQYGLSLVLSCTMSSLPGSASLHLHGGGTWSGVASLTTNPQR